MITGEAQIKECMSNPCSPIGTAQCEDSDNGYACKCNDGFVASIVKLMLMIVHHHHV